MSVVPEPSANLMHIPLHRIIDRIRKSLELQEILVATVAEVREFLGTDRVKIYQFQADGHGFVIAESVDESRLPPLLGLHFPADDIPSYMRELYVTSRQRTIVDLESQHIAFSPLENLPPNESLENSVVETRPLDPCHIEYLKAMGVKASIVLPIIVSEHYFEEAFSSIPLKTQNQLWGLLVAHHSEPYRLNAHQLSFLQAVVDQVSIAIDQSILLTRVREQAKQESDINQVIALLYTSPNISLQAALEKTVAVLQGSGGRLYLTPIAPQQSVEIYTCGHQPTPLDHGQGRPIEENLLWQRYLQSSLHSISQQQEPSPWSVKWMQGRYHAKDTAPTLSNGPIWAIADLYQEPLLRTLTPAFQGTTIRGLMIIPLQFGNILVGCLTIFRNEIDTEVIWAGYHAPDTRQLTPRQSFAAWQQINKGQTQQWKVSEQFIAQALSERFAVAVKQHRLYQEIQVLNQNLEQQIQTRTFELKQSTEIAEQQRTLANLLAKLHQVVDMETIFVTTSHELRHLLNVDRIAVYRFDADWGGEFVDHFGSVSPEWAEIVLAERKTWNDSYLQETQGGRYRNHEISVVGDIYTTNLSPCHIEVLERYHVRAFLIIPIFVNNQLWGLLSAYQHNIPRIWKTSEVTFLQQVSHPLGVTLQQFQTITQVQERTTQLQQSLRFEALLRRISDKVRDSFDENQILQTAVQEVGNVLNLECCCAYIYRPKETPSTVSYKYALTISSELSQVLEITQDYYSESTYYQQDEDCHRFCFTTPDRVENSPKYSILTCSIHDDQELFGELWLFRPAQACFDEVEARLIYQVTNQCAIALRQSRLYQHAQAQVRELERLNKLKDDFLNTVSHELRTPMTSIKMAISMLEIGLKPLGLMTGEMEKINRYFNILQEEAQREINLINNLLDLARLEADPDSVELAPIQLQTFLPPIVQSFTERAKNQNQTLQMDIPNHLPMILANEIYLERTISELLNNACKYTPLGEVITLSVTATSPNFFEIKICNSGIEIPEEEFCKIFDKFYRIPHNDPYKHGGTGLGLAMVKQLVECMGGKIGISSSHNQTTFSITGLTAIKNQNNCRFRKRLIYRSSSKNIFRRVLKGIQILSGKSST